MGAIQLTEDYYRFCPGEEAIKISNAVCRGRRRTHFPKCRECEFNDDPKGSPRSQEVVDEGLPRLSLIERLFRQDEVRGVFPSPLSEEAAWRIGHATAQYLRGKLRGYERADRSARSVVVGRDTRPQSRCLQAALIEGIRAYGADVVDIGLVDSPQLLFAVEHLGACGGIQTTGGHLPAEYTGFRFCGPKGVSIGLDTGLASIRDIAARVPRHQTGITATLTERSLSEPYTEFIRGFLVQRHKLPRPLKVVVDAGNGVAARWLPAVLQGLGNLTVLPLNFEHKATLAHDPDPCQARNTRELRKSVKAHRADAGVCFDSDMGRCVFVDGNGFAVASDLAAVLIARRLLEREPAAAVVYDLRSTPVLAEEIERAGGKAIPCRPDRPAIKKAMAEQNGVLGSDLAGGFYFRDCFFCESGLLAFVHLVNVLATSGSGLSKMLRPLQRYRSSGEIVLSCPSPDEAIKEVAAAHAQARVASPEGLTVKYADWWFNLRREGAQGELRLVLQARTKKLVEQRVTELKSLIDKGPA
jgi:phosphomannomutase